VARVADFPEWVLRAVMAERGVGRAGILPSSSRSFGNHCNVVARFHTAHFLEWHKIDKKN
jgi:hypothetical protein